MVQTASFRAGQPAPRPITPRVEALEDRTLLAVFGFDDRQWVANTTDYPWRAIGQIFVRFPDGTELRQTGALISPRHVLTSGHSVYSHDHGGWYTSLDFYPGTSGLTAPFGSASAVTTRTLPEWVNYASFDYDIALVTLDRRIGDTTGWFGFKAESDAFFANTLLNSAGYPWDLSNGTDMYYINGFLSAVGPLSVDYAGTLDIYYGQSGSPMWYTVDGNRSIVAVVNTLQEGVSGGAVRLTAERVNLLLRWMAEDDAPPPTQPSGQTRQLTRRQLLKLRRQRRLRRLRRLLNRGRRVRRKAVAPVPQNAVHTAAAIAQRPAAATVSWDTWSPPPADESFPQEASVEVEVDGSMGQDPIPLIS